MATINNIELSGDCKSLYGKMIDFTFKFSIDQESMDAIIMDSVNAHPEDYIERSFYIVNRVSELHKELKNLKKS